MPSNLYVHRSVNWLGFRISSFLNLSFFFLIFVAGSDNCDKMYNLAKCVQESAPDVSEKFFFRARTRLFENSFLNKLTCNFFNTVQYSRRQKRKCACSEQNTQSKAKENVSLTGFPFELNQLSFVFRYGSLSKGAWREDYFLGSSGRSRGKIENRLCGKNG